MKTFEYISARVVKVGECFEWTGGLDLDSYARAANNEKVHRSMFFHVNGFLPPVVRHSCDNRKCLNPEHLLAGDPVINMLDRKLRGRTHGHVTMEERELVFSLRKRGLSYEKIGKQLGVNPKRIEYICTRHKEF